MGDSWKSKLEAARAAIDAEPQVDAESLYRQLGRLLADPPNFFGGGALKPEHFEWMGRVRALIGASGDSAALLNMNTAMTLISAQATQQGVDLMKIAAYSALASAELKAPPGVKGAFIPASNSFDAFAALAKVLDTAKQNLMVVDPYLDEAALTEFGGLVPGGVLYRLLADKASYKQTLTVAAKKWQAQHGTARPIAIRLAPPKALHDRAIFVDGQAAWILTQSLKDFAKRSPAEIVRADDTAALKIQAYEEIWSAAEVMV